MSETNLTPAGQTAPAEFDYSGLDEQTVNDLHLAEREYAAGKRLAEIGLHRMADSVAIAHEAVVPNWDNSKHGSRGEDTFRRWCESIGVSKSAAYRLLQVTTLFDNSSPEQQKVLEEISPSCFQPTGLLDADTLAQLDSTRKEARGFVLGMKFAEACHE